MKLNYFLIPFFTFLVAGAGSVFTTSSVSGWYLTVNKPSWTPPGSIIGAVWTTLFILAAISALTVWNKAPHDKYFWWIISAFVLNAVLNVLWSYLFFSAHLIGPAVFEAILLGLSVLLLIFLIWPLSRFAALLLAPYAVWVFFASYLTYSIWRLN